MNLDKSGRAFVFDFGRVLFRWRPEVLVAKVLAHRAPDAAAVRHWVEQIFQGYAGDWQDFDRGTVEAPDLARRIATRTGLEPREVLAIIAASVDELQPLPETVDWLRRLHAQRRNLHFLSNMPEPMAGHFERTHDFMGLFQSGVFSSRAKLVKPEPAIFEHAAQVYGRPPAALLLIDDHLPNVEAARAAGGQALPIAKRARSTGDAGVSPPPS